MGVWKFEHDLTLVRVTRTSTSTMHWSTCCTYEAVFYSIDRTLKFIRSLLSEESHRFFELIYFFFSSRRKKYSIFLSSFRRRCSRNARLINSPFGMIEMGTNDDGLNFRLNALIN